MRSARIAELVLSLFASRERAASAVGDLMEDSPERGIFWFWWSVCRMAFSLLWHDLSAEPALMTRLAVRALVMSYVLLFVWLAVLAVCVGLCFGLLAIAGVVLPVPGSGAGGWIASLAMLLSVFFIRFRVGRWIGRRARGREMAACMGFVIADAIVTLVLNAVFTVVVEPKLSPVPDGSGITTQITDAALWVLSPLLDYVSVIAGGIRARREAGSRLVS